MHRRPSGRAIAVEPIAVEPIVIAADAQASTPEADADPVAVAAIQAECAQFGSIRGLVDPSTYMLTSGALTGTTEHLLQFLADDKRGRGHRRRHLRRVPAPAQEGDGQRRQVRPRPGHHQHAAPRRRKWDG